MLLLFIAIPLYAKKYEFPVILEDGWERAPAKIENQANSWVMGRHKKAYDKTTPFIKFIVPRPSEQVKDKKEARVILQELVQTISEQQSIKISWQTGYDWLTATYREKVSEDGEEIYRHLIGIWDGLNIRSIIVIVPVELGETLPYSCFQLLVKWLNPGSPPKLQESIQAAAGFQQAVQEDFDELFKRYLTKKANKNLKEINDSLAFSKKVQGLRRLIKNSVISAAGTMGNKRIIAYYHPYTDIMILTAWEKNLENIVMERAIMVDGVYMRKGNTKVPSSIPLWLNQKKSPPLIALGKITDKTLKKAENYSSVTCQYLDKKSSTVKNRRIVCASYFLTHLSNISEFYEDSLIKDKTFKFLRSLHEKNPELFSTKKDLENNSGLRGLFSLSTGYLETLSPIAYLKQQTANTLILSSPYATNSFVMLSFDRSENLHPVSKGIINMQDMLNLVNRKT